MKGRTAFLASLLCVLSSVSFAQEAASVTVFKSVSPSVVSLQNIEGVGTGTIVDEKGLILTNAHVLVSPLPLQVHVEVGEGEETKTVVFRKYWVVGVHRKYDLALLRVDLAEHNVRLKPATLSPEQAQTGEPVLAIGNPVVGPGKILKKTITQGILSNVERVIDGLPYYQFDASINAGNSGGPLCDHSGRVVGLVTFTATDTQGIAFAIPLDKFNTSSFISWNMRATDQKKAAELSQAAALYLKVAQERLRRFGKDDPGTQWFNYVALTLYRMSLMHWRHNTDIYFSIGTLYSALEQHVPAAAYLQRSIELEPWGTEDGKQYCVLGVALDKQDRQDDALIVWREGIAKYPKTAGNIWECIAAVLMKKRDYAEAAFAATAALRIGGPQIDKRKLEELRGDASRRLRAEARSALKTREANLWGEVNELDRKSKQARIAKTKYINADFEAFMKKFEAVREETEKVAEGIWGPEEKRKTEPEPKPEPTTPAPPTDYAAAKWIESRMAMARLCKQHGLIGKARTYLKEIVDKYPDKPATQEARKLLEEWKEPPE